LLQNAVMLDWNDLRYLIEVARAGSTSGAARSLGVNQTTVARRIDTLEHTLGIELFERRPSGYRLTERGKAALTAAERLEVEAAAFEAMASRWRRELSGSIRLTLTETTATYLLSGFISQLRKAHPGLRVELVVEDRKLDLVRGEADIAIRVGSEPKEPSLIARRLPDSCWSVYCSRAYAKMHGALRSLSDLNNHQLILGEGALAKHPGMVWLRRNAPNADVACRCNTLQNLYSLIRDGVGVSIMPCLVGEVDKTLHRCISPPVELRNHVWLVYHESLRRLPHVRVFIDALVTEIERRRPLLTCGLRKISGLA
jgi:DNA-binding transcriptional LysR family regulator